MYMNKCDLYLIACSVECSAFDSNWIVTDSMLLTGIKTNLPMSLDIELLEFM